MLWGGRVIIPSKLRDAVLTMLHEAHPRMGRMKSLTRDYVWWPRIDKEIEEKVMNCEKCQLHQNEPQGAPIHTWEHYERPWQRIHINHAGPVQAKTYLAIEDTYSEWLDVVQVSSSSAMETIRVLRRNFAIHGLPEVLVSDNGPGFISEEFGEFLKKTNVRHI